MAESNNRKELIKALVMCMDDDDEMEMTAALLEPSASSKIPQAAVGLCSLVKPERKKFERPEGYVMLNVPRYNDIQFRVLFRMGRGMFEKLMSEIELDHIFIQRNPGGKFEKKPW